MEEDEILSIISDQYIGLKRKSLLTANIAQGKNTVDLKLESGKK